MIAQKPEERLNIATAEHFGDGFGNRTDTGTDESTQYLKSR